MAKLDALKAALNSSANQNAAPSVQIVNKQKAKSREGKTNVSAWLNPEYKASLRKIQAKDTTRKLDDLIAEALNDLFIKHKVPTVRD